MSNPINRSTVHLPSTPLAALLLGMGLCTPAYGQSLNEDTKLIAGDGAFNDQFGYAVDIQGGLVAVGARNQNIFGFNSGSVYIIDEATGVLVQKIIPSDGAQNDLFGHSVAIDNGIVVVGAFTDDDNGDASGSAYIYNATTGALIAKLYPDDPDASDDFGISVAIDGGIVAVGSYNDDDAGFSSGSVYLFDVSTGAQLFKLVADDASQLDQLGFDVAIDNGLVVAGAHNDGDNGSGSGSAYVFDATTGTQLVKLLASDGMMNDSFGLTVDIEGTTVVVGSYLRDDGIGLDNSGAVYVFDALTGDELDIMVPDDRTPGHWFGNAVSIDNGIILIGASQDFDTANFAGAAYLFDASTGNQITKLLASDGGTSDTFGRDVSISNGSIVVGAYRNDDPFNPWGGAAYLFNAPAISCAADLTGDGELNFFDVSAFLSAFNDGDSSADFTGDGNFNFFDVSAFLKAFAAGCP
jgi:FG-GAP repeat